MSSCGARGRHAHRRCCRWLSSCAGHAIASAACAATSYTRACSCTRDHFPTPTAELTMDARTLWANYAKGDVAARDALLKEHLSLVHHVARQLSKSLVADADFDELVSSGVFG